MAQARELGTRLRNAHGWRGDQTPRQRALTRAGGFRRAQIARMFDVHPNQVRRWVTWGWLAVRYTRATTPTIAVADTTDLITFLERGGALLPYLRPADPFWCAMVADIRAELERQYISRTDLAALLALTPHALAHLMDRRGFPRPAIRMPAPTVSHVYDRAAVRTWLSDHPHYQTRRTKEEL